MYSLDDLLEAELRLTRAELKLTDAFDAVQQATVELEYALGNKVNTRENHL
jgi:outer membrane protein TolC